MIRAYIHGCTWLRRAAENYASRETTSSLRLPHAEAHADSHLLAPAAPGRPCRPDRGHDLRGPPRRCAVQPVGTASRLFVKEGGLIMGALKKMGSTELLLLCGVIGPPLFFAVLLIEGATRPGYN